LAALLPDGAATLFTNERIVSVDLAGESRPAHREISKNLSFRFTLRQFNQTKTFCRLILAMLCAVHQLIPPLREPISRPKKSISQKRRRLRNLRAASSVGSRRFQDDFAGGEKRFRRAGAHEMLLLGYTLSGQGGLSTNTKNERGRQLRYSKLVRSDQPSCGNLAGRRPLLFCRRLEWAVPAQPPSPLLGPLYGRMPRRHGHPLE
jgi:hypothetical protein